PSQIQVFSFFHYLFQTSLTADQARSINTHLYDVRCPPSVSGIVRHQPSLSAALQEQIRE
ncbi:hypothetical protein ABEQ76_22300, partial [Bacillus velezensis]